MAPPISTYLKYAVDSAAFGPVIASPQEGP